MRLCAFIAIFVLTGCSSSESSAPTGSDGGTGADGAGQDSGAPAALVPLPSTTDLRVEIGHQGTTTFQNSYFYNVRASGTERCATQAKGACFIRDCRGTGALPGALAAGKISVQNATGDVKWDLTVDGSKVYSTYQGTSKLIEGDAFKVTAEGGADLGAFNAEGVIPPKGPKLTAPVSNATVTRSEGLAFQWTAGDEGTLGLGIYQGGAPGADNIEIRCHVLSSAGAFTIPADVLAILAEEGIVTSKTNVFFGLELVTNVKVGADTVSVSAFSYVPFKIAVK